MHRRLTKSVPSNFFRQASGATFWNFAGMAITLINGVTTSRLLAPDDRGVLALALTISSLSFVFASVGTNIAVRVFEHREPWATFRTYFYLSAWLLLADIAIVAAAGLAFVMLGTMTFSWSLLAVGILGVATFASGQLLDVLSARGLISRAALVNTLGHLATLVMLISTFWLINVDRLVLTIMAYIAGFLARAVFVIVIVRKERIEIGSLSKDRGRALFKHGARFWGTNLGQVVTFRADQLLLAALTTTYAVGLYAVAATPAGLMQVVSNSIGQVVLREAAAGNLRTRSFLRATGAAFLLTAGYSALVWITAPVLIPFVFGEDYNGAVPLVRVLLVAELILCPYLIIIRALSGFNKPLVAATTGLVGLPTLIASMLLLVPLHGVVGAAYAVVVANLAMLVISVVGIVRAMHQDPYRDTMK